MSKFNSTIIIVITQQLLQVHPMMEVTVGLFQAAMMNLTHTKLK